MGVGIQSAHLSAGTPSMTETTYLVGFRTAGRPLRTRSAVRMAHSGAIFPLDRFSIAATTAARSRPIASARASDGVPTDGVPTDGVPTDGEGQSPYAGP